MKHNPQAPTGHYSFDFDLVTLKFNSEENLRQYLNARSEQLMAMISILKALKLHPQSTEVKEPLFSLLSQLSLELERLGKPKI